LAEISARLRDVLEEVARGNYLLAMRGGVLESLPAEMFEFNHLEEILLGDNQLTRLPPEIGKLTNLKTVGLSRNKLTTLPPEIGQLTNLKQLLLDHNELTSLPPEIGRLTNLRELQLDANRLASLPRELAGLLDRGLLLSVKGNPLDEPLPDLIRRGNKALAAYLRSLEDARPQYEAKLLLVGEGNVGKTSLVAALRDEPFVENRPTTHGINIQPLALAHPSRDWVQITLRTWDSGGQEVYRITHQFFFTPRAVYLLVWQPRQGQEQNEVEGWLRRIRLRVDQGARVLVVATHCDERNPELNYPRLQQTFPAMLAGQYAIDSKSQTGIRELRSAIAMESAQLPQMGQLLSPRWVDARDEILARRELEPQISFADFAAACQRHQMTIDETTTLAELLHDLGLIVYYGSDEGLRDVVVLNPEWLTEAIGYVLEDSPTRQAQGVLDHRRLRQIWQERPDGSAYPAHYNPYFLRLMEKFDVSYRLEGEDKSLVAQLVPYQQPELPWLTGSPLPEGLRRLVLVCELSEPAPGLMAWLTVRHHRASTGHHWREGVFLRHPIDVYDSEALLELLDDRHLSVEVRAPSPDLLFNVVRDSVEDLITRRWPGLRYELLVPCPTVGAEGRCWGQFKLESLLRRRERGRTSVTCQECDEDRDLAELLTGFAVPSTPLQPQLDRLQDRLSEVNESVHRLEAYAAETADWLRRILKATSIEITDCPRIFTLTLEQPAGLRRMVPWQETCRLTLWCEHPGHWHPWHPATYRFQIAEDWWHEISQYAALIFKGLQLVIPLAGAVAGVVNEELRKQFEPELELMKTLVGQLPNKPTELTGRERLSRLSAAEGAGLRALRELLFKQDPIRAFGDLRRVQAPAGDFLWVCAQHYPEYDPGLPTLPV
jgi:internalin A